MEKRLGRKKKILEEPKKGAQRLLFLMKNVKKVPRTTREQLDDKNEAS